MGYTTRDQHSLKEHIEVIGVNRANIEQDTAIYKLETSRINITTFFNFPDMFRRYIRHLQCYIF